MRCLVTGAYGFIGSEVVERSGERESPSSVPLPGEGRERFQPIALDDLARGIAHLAASDEPARITLDAAGPETVNLREILCAYRDWLGFREAREVAVPLPLLRVLLRLGDLAGYVGYVTSARSTSLAQLRYDTLVDGRDFAAAAGGRIKSFQEALAAWPATLQDRLHARSFFAVPLLQITAFFWIMTGVLTLTPTNFASATALLAVAGFGASLAEVVVAASSLVDQARSLILSWVRSFGYRSGCGEPASHSSFSACSISPA
jgi:hypothetical protein